MILALPKSARVFAYPAPVDLRKGFDGLYGLVEQGLKQDPMSGDIYLFVGITRRRCKVLTWDGTGLCLFQKRLQYGTFAKLWNDEGQTVTLSQRELAMFIEGSTFFARRASR